jgi:uncharacterized OsmC-like protein
VSAAPRDALSEGVQVDWRALDHRERQRFENFACSSSGAPACSSASARSTHMQEYEVSASVQRGGLATAQAKRSEIRFDGSAQQDPTLPGPAELLATAFAACALKNVERFSRILPFHYESASIHVVARREEHPPRIVSIRYTLTIATDEAANRMELLHRNIRKFGTVYNTLAAACRIDGEILVASRAVRRSDHAHAQ